MSSTTVNYEALAAQLAEAELSRRPVAPLSERHPGINLKDAYEIQRAGIATRLASGARIWGRKVGLTSLAMQRALGVDEPDFGVLLQDMVIDPAKPVDCGALIQPRIEAEIAVVLGQDLTGPGVLAGDVVAAAAGVLPALELIDSRIVDWRIKLVDTVADNASSARVAVGPELTVLDGVDLSAIEVRVSRDGELIETGTGEAVLGSPLNCVAWLANKLAEFDECLNAGQVIFAGALHKAFDVRPGEVVQAEFDRIGTVGLRFQGGRSG